MSDHSHHGTTHVDFDTPQMAEHAEQEAEVFGGLARQAITALAELCTGGADDVARVLDIGSGPGVFTCTLAERFPSAHVVAVDGSATMLQHVAVRASRLGLADRIETRRAELATDIDSLGHADLVWASLAIHHIGDEAAALRSIHGLLGPGGLLALVEIGEPLRILGTDGLIGRPGLWERLDAASAAWFTDMRADLPGTTASDDYPTMLASAGFEVVVDEMLAIVIDAPLAAPARELARRHLAGTRARLAGHADQADLAALDDLLDDSSAHSISKRDDITMRLSRHLYIARA